VPGVRLYLDAHSIIGNGLAVRDGVHVLKVHNRLPLVPYLATAIGVKEVDPRGEVQEWTPRLFVSRANQCFRKYLENCP
jgi:hypothetical protein